MKADVMRASFWWTVFVFSGCAIRCAPLSPDDAAPARTVRFEQAAGVQRVTCADDAIPIRCAGVLNGRAVSYWCNDSRCEWFQ